ncbi:hypothetical protein VIGAN_02311500 [Vigna angularis var. angularis]|uniref:Uncharacterized protein n=4 Tax=Phaseolus angularis TaxID=3914 RepID=A0A0S3RHL2_PHAAN|nr:hypothetical protein VIGAN_02311500 [Vigna angularis var. angularis]
MKVLIVLDDVNDLDHTEKLLGTLDNFGSGTRIIVTTRDKQVLKANKVDKIYQLKEFSSKDALELFNLIAFDQSDHQMEFNELSQRVVDYAHGIPLLVKVLARLLCGRNKEVWESQLHKLKKMSLTEVYDVMKLSYNGLDRKEKQIFLDLACFFLRSRVRVNSADLKYLLKDDESDDTIVVGLERLKDKALITSFDDNSISMHDALQEMAWEIVHQESSKSGSSNWLLDPNGDVYQTLKNDKGLGGIRSLRIHLPTTGKKKLIPGIFAEMSRLQFLEISVENSDDLFDQVYALAKELQFLETELRFLCWLNYPLKSLPENFCTDKLVILKLQYGRMEKLWDGLKNLVNLKELDLMHSKKLKKLPDLSQATNLEELVLLGCSMLTSMDSSIFSLPKLESIDLSGCKSLTLLTSNSQFCNFSYLNLDFCKNLREFSLISQNMKELRLGFTKVKVLPSSFECHSKLKSLHLTRSDIEMLPSSFNNLTQLQHLDINNCNKLQTIPELPPSLKTLEVSKCKSLQNLRNLPSSLKTLNAIECKSLKTVSFPSTADEQLTENKKRVLFWNCRNLDESSAEAIGLNAEINLMELANQPLPTPSQEHQFYNDYEYNYHSYQGIYVYPGSSVPAWFKHTEANGDIIIDLSSASPFELFGFIFCFVLNKFHDTDIIGRLEFNITISDVDDVDEGKMGSVKIYIDCYSDWSIAPYHVCVMFDQRCSSTLNNIARKQKRFKINVSVGARIEFYDNYHELPQEVLKGFGVSPISISAYNIQQIEL